jgi:hypothetical protein
MWHMIQHWFGWNTGNVVSKIDDDRNIWIGFECAQCGKVSGAHISRSL